MSEENKPKLYLVSLRGCPPCEGLQEQLKDEEIKKKLAEKFGTDEVDTLYADEEGEMGNKARNICYSLDKFSGPILVVEKQEESEKKAKVCLINENLEEEQCGLYRELPL